MLLFPLALILGVLTGIAAGGRLKGLVDLRLRAPAVPVAALVVQALLPLPAAAVLPQPFRLVVLGASYAAAGGWLALNLVGRSTPIAGGLAVTCVGWLLNMCVVLANAGMPVSASALTRLGLATNALSGGGPLGKHVMLAGSSTLGLLGDTIAVPTLSSIVSIGDVVMLAGLVLTVAAAMRAPGPAVRPLAAG